MLTLIENIKWGVTEALKICLAYGAWIVVVYILGGAIVFSKTGLRIGSGIALYLVAPLCAGLIVGALRSLTRWFVGRLVVGTLAAVPICLCGYMIVLARDLWHDRLIPLTIITAVFVGPMFVAFGEVDIGRTDGQSK